MMWHGSPLASEAKCGLILRCWPIDHKASELANVAGVGELHETAKMTTVRLEQSKKKQRKANRRKETRKKL